MPVMDLYYDYASTKRLKPTMVSQPCNLSIYESEAEGLQFKALLDQETLLGLVRQFVR